MAGWIDCSYEEILQSVVEGALEGKEQGATLEEISKETFFERKNIPIKDIQVQTEYLVEEGFVVKEDSKYRLVKSRWHLVAQAILQEDGTYRIAKTQSNLVH